jgi:hypothetical protein
MKACGHEHVTVEGCDTCYIVKLKKRVDKLLAAEYKRLERIALLESALQFYANKDNWAKDSWGVMSVMDSEYGDPGLRAREALQGRKVDALPVGG